MAERVTQPSEQPTGPFYWAGCPICGSEHVMRLRDDWQAQVASGAAIPIVGCGNPWHYFLDRVAATPDPVASPDRCADCDELEVNRLHHESRLVSYHRFRLEGQPVAESPDAD